MKHCAGQIKYLVAIKELSDTEEYVRCVTISRHLGVSRPSVSKMLRCLANCGYVYEDFCITLSDGIRFNLFTRAAPILGELLCVGK